MNYGADKTFLKQITYLRMLLNNFIIQNPFPKKCKYMSFPIHAQYVWVIISSTTNKFVQKKWEHNFYMRLPNTKSKHGNEAIG